jgi:hypothetical protein
VADDTIPKARYNSDHCQPYPWIRHGVKKQVERMWREARPDLVHAHDIFAAKMISELGVPFVSKFR